MASEIHYQAELIGQASPGAAGPAALMGLDEATRSAPSPAAWLSDSGGKGIQIMSVAHGGAAPGRWDEHGKQVVLTPPV
jgi:hypothetical protein